MLFGLLSKVVFAVGGVVAAFVVAWHFYIHDHAARTEGGVAASLARELDAGDVRCHEAGREWRCRVGEGRARHTAVVRRGRKNCWRLAQPERGTTTGCVKVLDYVGGLL